ncbi:hypothetical protein BPO_0140 [Bergeyella porcorum]|uniref:Uncharacterized protein n=1 Tax=Bergeyella porcorum TaxID=1735111 RepID=A0AAU0EZI7_9FLAO
MIFESSKFGILFGLKNLKPFIFSIEGIELFYLG